jgi:hypothetical protein
MFTLQIGIAPDPIQPILQIRLEGTNVDTKSERKGTRDRYTTSTAAFELTLKVIFDYSACVTLPLLPLLVSKHSTLMLSYGK